MCWKSTVSCRFILTAIAASFLLCLSCSNKPSSGSVLLRINGDKQLDVGLGAQVEKFADVNDDGIPEIIAVAPYELTGNISVYSGASGQLMYRILSEREKYKLASFRILVDLTGDTIPEIAAADSWSNRGLWIFSGEDGTPLFRFDEKLYFRDYRPPDVVPVLDQNSDGVPDIALDQPRRGLVVFSGKDGSKLMEFDRPTGLDEHVRYGRTPDVDGDGHDDLIGLTTVRKPVETGGATRVVQAFFLSSKGLTRIGVPFELSTSQRPDTYLCADINEDGVLDIIYTQPGGGEPEGSVLLAVSGKDGSEIWRVNGAAVEDGSKMMTVDAKTGKTVSTYTDIRFDDSLALLPDMNGDGVSEVATGHPSLYSKERKTGGCIYIFSGKDGSILNTLYSPDSNSRFGGRMSPFADWNFDGTPDILVGVHHASVEGRKKVGSILIVSL